MSTSGNTLEAESQSPRRLIGFFSMAISLLHTGVLTSYNHPSCYTLFSFDF
ncbi:hypothetical protein LXL04_001955 [Taraxacum kok-saghyz]